jgi:hypothetical protein
MSTERDFYTLGGPVEEALFKQPETRCWPSFFWGWNSGITEELIRRQIDSFAARSIKRIYIIAEPSTFRPESMPTSLLPVFDTDEYYRMYRYAADYAALKGIEFWLYDEPGWPSGSAHGLVVRANPDVELKRLIDRSLMVKAGETYTVPDDVLAAFIWDNKRIPGSFTAEEDTAVIEYQAEKQSWYSTPYPNLIDRRSTETLINVFFEKYKKHLGHLFGKNIRLFFIDEPGVTSRPWTHGFEEEFRNRFDYEIRDYLPAIMWSVMQGEKGIGARIDFYDLSSELFAKHYFLGQKKWCNENGLLLIGHLSGEDETTGCIRHGYLHLMRCLRAMDIPGVDAIWRQIFPGKKKTIRILDNNYEIARNHFFPRYASSAASQIGRGLSFTESGAVYGMGLTFEEQRFITLFQMVRGINIVNYIGLFSGSEGALIGAEPPNYTDELPQSWDLPVFNEYIARFSYLMTLGPIVADAALYEPMRDIWADEALSSDTVNVYEETAFVLEKLHCYFEIIDDDVILGAGEKALDCGELRAGLAVYTTVYIPVCRYMPDAVKARLRRFIAGGGKAYIIGKLPGERGPSLAVEGARTIGIEMLKDNTVPLVEVAPACEDIRVIKRKYPGGAVYLLFNESTEKAARTIRFNESLPVCEADAYSGGFRRVDSTTINGKTEINVGLEGGEGRAFMFGNHKSVSIVLPRVDTDALKTILEIKQFTFKRTKRFVVSNRYVLEEIDEPPKAITLGDWRESAGDDFSGSGVYIASFPKPAAKGTICLDLGTVKYAAEVTLNGESLGVRCMPPCVYALDAEKLKDDNALSIRVTNTGANEFIAKNKALMEKYTMRRLGSYYVMGVYFARDSLPSGLFGPVRILAYG